MRSQYETGDGVCDGLCVHQVMGRWGLKLLMLCTCWQPHITPRKLWGSQLSNAS
jgi:hypothetical protein